MNVRFRKGVDRGRRHVLLNDLRRYARSTEMTMPERRKLYRWVAKGNNPYDNPWFYYEESGNPMGYIEAVRMLEAQLEEMLDVEPAANPAYGCCPHCGRPFEAEAELNFDDDVPF